MSAKLMQAVQYNSYGGGASGLKHVEVPVPSPKTNEVLLKLEATSINPVDWKIQDGFLRPFFLPRKFPHIPYTNTAHLFGLVYLNVFININTCTDVAGEVVEYGGGLAQFAVASESSIAARPSEVSAAEGAGLPIAGLTARDALTKIAGVKLDGTGEPKNVLVTAASGGVGAYAIQLAKLGNNHVTATCGARNVDLVKDLGADEVLDYKTPEGATLKSPSGRKYDAVVNCASGIPWSTFEPNLTEKGIVVYLAPNPGVIMTYALKKLTFSKKRPVPFSVIVKREGLEHLAQLVKDGKLKTVIDSKFPLNKAEDAWAKSIDGHAAGKIIVEL
ncbi:hypothetical protein TSUD_269810 [Trifolium subterraneum]|uniref:Enoyl reductase (ER) domain-containing protein n=1 Tax=Trifolium subterraneum TaxID=3900 RepID=A0A2Z6N1Y4_TRISU|nr:hypothetical protein TSUD_269810 [Trifolium subterraneum]